MEAGLRGSVNTAHPKDGGLLLSDVRKPGVPRCGPSTANSRDVLGVIGADVTLCHLT